MQLAAALHGAAATRNTVCDEAFTAQYAVNMADLVITKLEEREAQESKERAALDQVEREAKAKAEAAKADAATGAETVEPH